MTERIPLSAAASRKIESGRYFKRNGFCLDHDSGGYTNVFAVFDGDKATGITVTDSGHTERPGSHKRLNVFRGQKYATLREAIFAYEDQEPQP